MVDVIAHFQLPRLILVGHSLGGGVASLVTSMLGPTVIAKLVMIDTLGAWPASARDTPRILAESAAFVAASSQPHESIQSAAEYRAKKNFVGLMHIDDALLLAQRGTVPAPQHGPNAVVWNYDPFLKRASPLRMTPDQALACVDQLRVPTLVLLARDGLFNSILTPFGKLVTSFGKQQQRQQRMSRRRADSLGKQVWFRSSLRCCSTLRFKWHTGADCANRKLWFESKWRVCWRRSCARCVGALRCACSTCRAAAITCICDSPSSLRHKSMDL